MFLNPRPRRFLRLFLLLVIAVAIGRLFLYSESSWKEIMDRGRRHVISAPKHEDVGHFDISSVVVMGSDYSGEKDDILANHSVELVLVLPHKLEYDLKTKGVEALSSNDYKSVQQLARFLNDNHEFDAATGITEHHLSATPDVLLMRSACRYLTKNWTIIIHNTGPMPIIVNHKSGSAPLYFQRCNFAETAFVIRKQIFQSIGWRSEFGKTSVLDFFLRSEGRIKLAKLAGVTLSGFCNRVDRGKLEMKMEFTDYTEFGNRHNILRIVYPNRIEWTKCAEDAELCPEKSISSETKLQSEEIMPICCSVVMNDMLVAFTSALDKLGVDYRLAYGTLLGAVRSQAIIPYTDDVDIVVHKKDNDNITLFAALQELTGPRLNVIMKMRETQPVSNVLAHFTPTVFTDTSKYFQNDDYLEGRAFFTKDVLLQMKKLLPIENTVTERRFIDVYPSPEDLFAAPASIVTINGRKYPGVKYPDKALKKWYGEDYMAPNTEKHSMTSFA